MPTTAERLAALEQMTTEIHMAVVGDGSRQSSLRERIAALESSNDWRHRAIYSVFPSLFVSLLAHFGIPAHGIGGQQ